MNLQADRDGFLVGIPLGDAGSAETLAEIKGDTGAILALMRRGARTARAPSARASLLGSPAAAVMSPGGRASMARVRDPLTGRFQREGSPPSGTAARPSAAGAAAVAASAAQTRAAADQVADSVSSLVRAQEADRLDAKTEAARERAGKQYRGANGRFGSGGAGGGAGAGDAIGNAGAASIEAARTVDPLLSSIGEVADFAQSARNVVVPLGRFLPGRAANDESSSDAGGGWFRRMWRELRLMRRDSAKGTKEIARNLKAQGSAGDSDGGGIGGLIMAALRGPLMAVMGVGVAGLVGWFTGSALNRWLDSLNLGERFGKAWDGLVASVGELFKPLGEWVTRLFDWVGSLPGMGALRSAGSSAAAFAGDAARKGGEWLQTGRDAAQSAAAAAANAGRAALGWVAKRFESGQGGAGTVSTGRGDHGGVSYGAHQLSSNAGTLQRFLGGSSYGAQFAGLTPGSQEFNAKWKQVASVDPEFGKAQQAFMERTHFAPMMDRLKRGGIDLSGRGEAVRESVFSTATQFGPGHGLINDALAGRNVAAMSDAEVVAAIQDYKIANNDGLFRSSSEEVRTGTLRRAHAEKGQLLALAGVSAPSFAIAAPKAAQGVRAPSMPTPAAIAAAPKIDLDGLGRIAPSRQAPPAAPPTPPAQDVSDRTIAHIVTGGIGALPRR
jgi:hypothetical protein